ncbi:MAG TPA: 1,6-anhydro-N-acetylmuramyl-L-alanine amidase AmpD [Gammaproteobacteria bacterium]|nr:1,6-anhydro-N-acetylmuramyl-L-alanine amidase AmpD [Gammaproteobacteria bacterium]|tara:strand:- start:2409 stop:2990 length:582 start_codon:yes stop_codon:yes gene_type:complete
MECPRITLESSGWFTGVQKIESPNFDLRPDGNNVELVVIHAISLPPGEFGGGHIDRLFKNCLDPTKHSYFEAIHGLKVSAHLLIERTGLLKQFVSTTHRAWHSGDSVFAGRNACNDFSVGIELEGCDDVPFTSEQYTALTDVLAELCINYPGVKLEDIVGHCDIAPDRKTDPGPLFDWPMMRALLRDRLERYT